MIVPLNKFLIPPTMIYLGGTLLFSQKGLSWGSEIDLFIHNVLQNALKHLAYRLLNMAQATDQDLRHVHVLTPNMQPQSPCPSSH